MSLPNPPSLEEAAAYLRYLRWQQGRPCPPGGARVQVALLEDGTIVNLLAHPLLDRKVISQASFTVRGRSSLRGVAKKLLQEIK